MYCSTLVPTPNVSITNQTFNNSVSLECIITTVKGISVDIVWKVNNETKNRRNNSLGNAVNNSTIHKDVYNISNVGGEGTEYHCYAVINENSVANGKQQVNRLIHYIILYIKLKGSVGSHVHVHQDIIDYNNNLVTNI